MDLNITVGVFMVLMIAVATAILLCCCRAYVLCKRRQSAMNESVRRRNPRGIPQHLPVGRGTSYSDQPPSYDDILTGRVRTILASRSNCHNVPVSSDPKSTEERMVVRCCNDDSTAPPLYSCVVLDENSDSELPPPDYYFEIDDTDKESVKTVQNSVDNTAYDVRSNSVSQRFHNAINAMSHFLSGARRPTATTDPVSTISCDSDVIETPTSSQVTSVSNNNNIV